MSIPDSVLLKEDSLTPEEWEIMRRHPAIAHDMLVPIPFLKSALEIPYRHHERWDGSGYPGGLKGEEIPQAARIFAVVDVWDALREKRPYRDAWPDVIVREYLASLAGVTLDPQAVEVFLRLLENSTVE